MCPHCALTLFCMAVEATVAIDWQAWLPVICTLRPEQAHRRIG